MARTILFLATLALLLGGTDRAAHAACLRVPDHLRGYELRPGLWVFVCTGVGVDYVKRNHRLITWRTSNPAPSGLHPVRFLDVRRVLGYGVNWVSVAVDPAVRHGLQHPGTLDIIQPAAASPSRQAAMTMQLYADGRRHARFAGVDLPQGTRDGQRLAFTRPGRITIDGSAQFYPDGRGGWQMRCRFGVIEYDYYGKGRDRQSSFAGRRGELRRYH